MAKHIKTNKIKKRKAAKKTLRKTKRIRQKGKKQSGGGGPTITNFYEVPNDLKDIYARLYLRNNKRLGKRSDSEPLYDNKDKGLELITNIKEFSADDAITYFGENRFGQDDNVYVNYENVENKNINKFKSLRNNEIGVIPNQNEFNLKYIIIPFKDYALYKKYEKKDFKSLQNKYLIVKKNSTEPTNENNEQTQQASISNYKFRTNSKSDEIQEYPCQSSITSMKSYIDKENWGINKYYILDDKDTKKIKILTDPKTNEPVKLTGNKIDEYFPNTDDVRRENYTAAREKNQPIGKFNIFGIGIGDSCKK
jgi:hypothetical protein